MTKTSSKKRSKKTTKTSSKKRNKKIRPLRLRKDKNGKYYIIVGKKKLMLPHMTDRNAKKYVTDKSMINKLQNSIRNNITINIDPKQRVKSRKRGRKAASQATKKNAESNLMAERYAQIANLSNVVNSARARESALVNNEVRQAERNRLMALNKRIAELEYNGQRYAKELNKFYQRLEDAPKANRKHIPKFTPSEIKIIDIEPDEKQPEKTPPIVAEDPRDLIKDLISASETSNEPTSITQQPTFKEIWEEDDEKSYVPLEPANPNPELSSSKVEMTNIEPVEPSFDDLKLPEGLELLLRDDPKPKRQRTLIDRLEYTGKKRIWSLIPLQKRKDLVRNKFTVDNFQRVFNTLSPEEQQRLFDKYPQYHKSKIILEVEDDIRTMNEDIKQQELEDALSGTGLWGGKQIGSPTSSTDLLSYCKDIPGFRGILLSDEVLENLSDNAGEAIMSFIVNTNTSRDKLSKIGHWVVIWVDTSIVGGQICFYDPYGRNPPTNIESQIKQFVKQLPNKLKYKVNTIKHQTYDKPDEYSSTCGIHCTIFIQRMDEYDGDFKKAVNINEQHALELHQLLDKGEKFPLL